MEPTAYSQIWMATLLLFLIGGTVFYVYYRRREPEEPDNKAYLLALKYMAENDRRRAIEKFKEAVREDSTNIDAYLKLGDLLRMEKLYNNAIRIHKDLTLRGDIPQDLKYKIWYSLGLDYWHAERPDNALEYFRKLETHKQFNDDVAVYLSRIYEKNDDYIKAFETLKQSSKNPDPAILNRMALYKVMEGLKAVDQGEEKNARILFKEALKFDDTCAPAYLYTGDSYLREERPKDAIHIWNAFCRKNGPQAYLAFSRLEKAWYEKGQFFRTVELYEDLLKKDAANIHAVLALSRIYRKKGEFDQALAIVDEGLKQEKDVDLLHAEQLRIYAENGQASEAAERGVQLAEKLFTAYTNSFICPECGHLQDTPFWKCPTCQSLITGQASYLS